VVWGLLGTTAFGIFLTPVFYYVMVAWTGTKAAHAPPSAAVPEIAVPDAPEHLGGPLGTEGSQGVKGGH